MTKLLLISGLAIVPAFAQFEKQSAGAVVQAAIQANSLPPKAQLAPVEPESKAWKGAFIGSQIGLGAGAGLLAMKGGSMSFVGAGVAAGVIVVEHLMKRKLEGAELNTFYKRAAITNFMGAGALTAIGLTGEDGLLKRTESGNSSFNTSKDRQMKEGKP